MICISCHSLSYNYSISVIFPYILRDVFIAEENKMLLVSSRAYKTLIRDTVKT